MSATLQEVDTVVRNSCYDIGCQMGYFCSCAYGYPPAPVNKSSSVTEKEIKKISEKRKDAMKRLADK